MNTVPTKLAITAIVLSIAAIPITASAQPPYWDNGYGTLRAVDVYTDDLNLADPRDRDEAAWRIEQAVNLACHPFPDVRALDEVGDYNRCRAEAFDDAMNDLEARADRPRRHGHVYTREYPGSP